MIPSTVKSGFIFILFSIVMGLCACRKLPLKTGPILHKIHAIPVETVNSVIPITLLGKVSRAGSFDAPKASLSTYIIDAVLPAGAQPAIVPGDRATVMLPILHNENVKATLTQAGERNLRFSLTGQVQALDGETVRVVVSLKPTSLYKVPFSSIYSPRGLNTQVFIFDGEKVELSDVTVIRVLENNSLLIVAALPAGTQVVTSGIDNLTPGDHVTNVLSEEASL